jgi:hypothetical protein
LKHDQEVFTIAPGETVNYAWDFNIIQPGAFETGATLFVYDTDLRQIELTVRGVGVAAGGSKNAKQSP